MFRSADLQFTSLFMNYMHQVKAILKSNYSYMHNLSSNCPSWWS